MYALVFSGQFKNETLLKAALEGEKFMAHNFGQLEGCKGGMFIYKDDNSFKDVSLWENKDDIEKMMDNPLMKGFEKAFEGAFTREMQKDIYNVGVTTEIAHYDQ